MTVILRDPASIAESSLARLAQQLAEDEVLALRRDPRVEAGLDQRAIDHLAETREAAMEDACHLDVGQGVARVEDTDSQADVRQLVAELVGEEGEMLPGLLALRGVPLLDVGAPREGDPLDQEAREDAVFGDAGAGAGLLEHVEDALVEEAVVANERVDLEAELEALRAMLHGDLLAAARARRSRAVLELGDGVVEDQRLNLPLPN